MSTRFFFAADPRTILGRTPLLLPRIQPEQLVLPTPGPARLLHPQLRLHRCPHGRPRHPRGPLQTPPGRGMRPVLSGSTHCRILHSEQVDFRPTFLTTYLKKQPTHISCPICKLKQN